MAETALVLTKEEKTEMETAVASYVDKVLFDVTSAKAFEIPQANKLAFLQYTRPAWTKTRKIGSHKNDKTGQWEDDMCDYIPIRKAERLLNFLFNFDWESKLIEQKYEQGESKKGAIIHEAFVIMEFTCNFFWKQIKRTVSWSWKMYDNAAVSKFAVVQAAISQATKNFAKLYGIGADLNDDIEDRFSETAKAAPTEESTDADMAGMVNDFNNNSK